MAEIVRLGTHNSFINKLATDTSTSSADRMGISPLGSKARIDSLVREGRLNNDLSANLGRGGSQVDRVLNTELAQAEEETQDHEPTVTNIGSRANQRDLSIHQIVFVNRKCNVGGSEAESLVNVANIARLNIMARKEYRALLKSPEQIPLIGKKENRLTTSEVAAALAIDNLKSTNEVEYGNIMNNLDTMRKMQLDQVGNDEKKKKAINDHFDKFKEIGKFRSNDIACSLYAPLFSETWGRLGALNTVMPVTKISRTLQNAARTADDTRTALAVFMSGRVEIRDIWPYKKSPGAHLYLLLTAVPIVNKQFGPLQIVPWCTEIAIDRFPNVENLLYHDISEKIGETNVVDAFYFGTLIDDNGHDPPSPGLVFSALGVNINEDADFVTPSDDLFTANAYYSKLPMIKVNMCL